MQRWFSAQHTVKKTEEKERILLFAALPVLGRAARFCKPKNSPRKNFMKNFFTTKRLCRAGIIAALYTALTYAFAPLAFNGILQVRPAEALTILPLFFPEAVPALWVGCMLSNLASPFLVYDVPIGGAATLIAATLTFLIGYVIKNDAARAILGGLPPIIINAVLIPVIIVFLCPGGADGFSSAAAAYWLNFGSLCATEALWVYGLGVPAYFAINKFRKMGVTAFTDAKKQPASAQTDKNV